MLDNLSPEDEYYEIVDDYYRVFKTVKHKEPRKLSLKKKLLILFTIIVVPIVLFEITHHIPSLLHKDSTPSDQTVVLQTTTRSYSFEDSEMVESQDELDGDYYIVSVGKGNRLSLRLAPSTESEKLDRIDNGTRLYIIAVQGNWGQTSYNGKTGWVCLQENGDQYCVKE